MGNLDKNGRPARAINFLKEIEENPQPNVRNFVDASKSQSDVEVLLALVGGALLTDTMRIPSGPEIQRLIDPFYNVSKL